MKPRAVAGIMAVALAGCASSPELTRRYAEIRPGGAADLAVELSLFTLPVPAPGSRSLTDLGSGAQTAFVNVARDRTETMAEFAGALGTRIPALPEPEGIDATRLRRRVVLSVRPYGLGPADRIDRLSVRLELASPTYEGSPAWRFVSWDRFATRYETVALGSLESSQSAELGLSAGGVPLGSAGGEGEAGAEWSRGLSEEVELRQRYVAVTGALADHTATIYQEGMVGIDLTGNVSIDLELAAVAASPPLQRARLDANEGARTLVWSDVTWPATDDRCSAVDIRVNLVVEYRVRQVLSGAATVIEGDDTIRYVEGTRRTPGLVLVPAREQRLTLWEIVRDDAVLTLARTPLLFATAAEAQRLAGRLLADRPAEVAGQTLLLGETAFAAGPEHAGLAVRPHPVNWNCSR